MSWRKLHGLAERLTIAGLKVSIKDGFLNTS